MLAGTATVVGLVGALHSGPPRTSRWHAAGRGGAGRTTFSRSKRTGRCRAARPRPWREPVRWGRGRVTLCAFREQPTCGGARPRRALTRELRGVAGLPQSGQRCRLRRLREQCIALRHLARTARHSRGTVRRRRPVAGRRPRSVRSAAVDQERVRGGLRPRGPRGGHTTRSWTPDPRPCAGSLLPHRGRPRTRARPICLSTPVDSIVDSGSAGIVRPVPRQGWPHRGPHPGDSRIQVR